MERRKLFNIVDLSINVLIVLCTIGAVAYYFFAEGVGNMLVHGAECFKYFTIESNVLAAITCVIYIVFNIIKIKKPDYIVPTWALILKFVGTISVSVTFVMVVFVIAPGYAVIYDASYFDNFSHNSFFLHFLTPVLAIISLTVFEKDDDFDLKFHWFGFIPVFLYSILYGTMVVILKIWEDFYYFIINDNIYLIWIPVVGIYSLSIGLQYGLWYLRKYVRKKLPNSKIE